MALKNNGLDRYLRRIVDTLQFERAAAWVGEIDNGKPRHLRENSDRVRKIFAPELSEVEKHWHKIVAGKFVANCVQNNLPLWREPAENEHNFRCNGVNGITDFWVIEKQVDKLGNFEL